MYMKKKKEIEEAEEEKIKYVNSAGKFEEGLVVEMINDDECTKYLYSNDGQEVGEMYSYEGDDNVVYLPYQKTNSLIQNHIVEFPSGITDYEDFDELLKSIRVFIHTYVDIPEDFEIVCSYYVILSWVYDRFHEVPYLRVIGDYGTGKSRLIKTVGNLCYRPIKTTGATNPAGIFRILNDIQGTLLLDEADFRYSDTTETIIKILNSGYEKGSPLIRMEANKNGALQIKSFKVYGPKIIGTREPFTDKALESRCFTEHMGMSSIREDIPRNLDDGFYSQATHIRNMLLSYRFECLQTPVNGQSELISGIHPRLQQIALPMLQIMKNNEHRTIFKAYMRKQNDELIADRSDNWEAEIVKILLAIKSQNVDQASIKDISVLLNKHRDPDEPLWNPKKVGWLIKKKLSLTRTRITRGYVVSITENAHKVDMYRERFGITEQDIQVYLEK